MLQKLKKRVTDFKTLWKYLIILYAVCLPWGTALINISFGLIIAFWILHSITFKLKISRDNMVFILVFSGLYIYNVISLIYTDNIQKGIDKVLLQIYLLVFPFILLSLKKTVMDIRFLVKVIWFSTLSFSALCVLSIINQIIKYSNENGSSFFGYFMENNLSTSITDYYFLGLSLALSVLIILNTYLKLFHRAWVTNFHLKYCYLICGFLFFNLLLLNSRTLIFVTTFALATIFAISAYKRKNKSYILIIILGLGLIINALFNPAFSEKIKEAVNYENKYNVTENWGGRAFRFLIWDCAVKVIKQNPVFGVGLGDQQDELTLCYKIYMRDQLLYNKPEKNAHNIFLQTGISAGFIGIILMCLMFLYPIIKLSKKNSVFLIFSITFILAGITESYFQRNVSIAFYSFFNMICFLITQNDENTPNT